NITNGPAKFANLILEINRRYPEHQVHVLTEDAAGPHPIYPGHVHRVHLRIPALLKPLGQILRMFQYYRRVKELDQAHAFDVLVYNNAFTGLYAALVSRRPTVGMINDEKNLTAGLGNFTPGPRWLKRFAFRYLEKLSARRHAHVITNSDYLTAKVRAAYALPPAKVSRLYKAVDLRAIPYAATRPCGDPVRILFVKADYYIGGLDVLVEALRRLPHQRFRLTVVGPEKQFEKNIYALCALAGNAESHYLGAQPQAAVFRHLLEHDIFCVPSRSEALGVANIEALASGIPVVSTRVGGIPEVMDYGNNGWLTEAGNAADLAAAIGRCIGNPEERAAKGASGKAFVGRFDKEQMLQHFLTILQRVCG
ncbi:MAG TPA: glycosyltransferase family 4 protein, partial [Cytophagales bacterium]